MMENKKLLTQNSIFSETILQKFKKINIFLDLKKAEHIQHTSNANDTKESSLYRRKMFQKVSTELQEGMKRTGSGYI